MRIMNTTAPGTAQVDQDADGACRCQACKYMWYVAWLGGLQPGNTLGVMSVSRLSADVP